MYKTIRSLSVVALCLAAFAAPATAGDTDEGQALVRDLLTIVSVAEKQVWTIDHYEIEDLMGNALMCVCHTRAGVREAARAELKASIANLGGPAKALWARSKGQADNIDELVTLERTLATLDRADGLTEERCSFLQQPQTPYVERQRANGRVFLASEGGGLFNIRLGDEELRMGGGGSGRVALGYGINERWSVRAGAEFGGAGLLNENFEAEEVDLDFYAAIPVVLRHRTLLWHQDLDMAMVAHGAFWKESPRFAVRLGGLFGLTYSRIGAVQPWGGLKMSAEYAPKLGHAHEMLTIRVGLRFGVDFHL